MAASDIKVVADFTDLQLMRRELVGVSKDAKSSASVFEREYNKVSNALSRSAKSGQAYYNETLKIDRASKSATASASAMEAAFKRQEVEAKKAAQAIRAATLEEERLKSKFVEGYTAMNIYSKELNDLAVARRKDIITADQQKDAIQQLNAQMKAGTGAFANAATGMQIVGRKASRTGVLAQQAGYQFGDFAVQVQSGTNPMIAFGQQATQLIGTFSMLARSTKAIVAFSALGVIVPVLTAIGGALMRVREAAKETEDSFISLKTIQEDLKQSTEEATLAIIQQERGLKSLEEAFLSKAISDAKTALEEYRIETERQVAATLELALAEAVRNRAAGITAGLTDAELIDLATQANEALVQSRQEELAVLQQTYNELVTIRNNEDARERSQRRQNNLLQEYFEFFEDARIEIEKAEEALKRMPANQEALRKGAESFLEIWKQIKLTIATSMAVANQSPNYSGRGTSAGAGSTEIERTLMGMGGEVIPGKPTTSTGGGASGATDPLLGQMEQLETFLATERELLLVEYETRQMTLEQSLEKEYLTRQQYADMTLELEGRKNKELRGIELKTQQQKVSIVAGGIQNVLNAAANGNERLLKAARVFGAAEALINSYRAASQTLADPTLPFYVKFGAAASVLAAGFGMVNAIKGGGSSKSMSGGLSGGGATSRPSGAEASVPTQSAPQAQRVLIKGLGPKDLLTGEMLQELFDKLYDENQERGAVFMVST